MSDPIVHEGTQHKIFAAAHVPDTLIRARDLQVAFGHGARQTLAVKGVSFTIGRGETVALVGESGSGKTVSAMSILKLLQYPAASHPGGEIFFEGTDLLTAPEATMRQIRGRRISIIFQEPMTSLNPLQTIGQQVTEIVKLHRPVSDGEARVRMLELLRRVGIPEPERRLAAYPHQMSGGQRQRIMIAMALANEPDLLIADEPTTALDVTIQAQILDLLAELKAETGMAMLLITHDLGIVRKLAERVYVMRHGEIVEEGETEQIFTAPRHDYTKMLISAEPKGRAPDPQPDAPLVVETRDLKVWFPIKQGLLRKTVDYIKAVDGISLQVRAGETIGVVGESGSGKTTLGLAVMRLISSKGPILFMGREINGFDSRAMRPLRRDMQIVFQDPYGSLSPRLSIGQIIEEGLTIQYPGLDAATRRQRVGRALETVGLPSDAQDRYPHEFSGGQRQRIAIARAMVLEPKFVMLDEPTSALDRSVQAQIVDLLRELQQARGLSYLFISHDLRVVRALANYVIVMKSGRIVEQGPANAIFDNPQQAYTKALLAAAFDLRAVAREAVAS